MNFIGNIEAEADDGEFQAPPAASRSSGTG
jgi:hypothetical protein